MISRLPCLHKRISFISYLFVPEIAQIQKFFLSSDMFINFILYLHKKIEHLFLMILYLNIVKK